jgi:hypothetical protein
LVSFGRSISVISVRDSASVAIPAGIPASWKALRFETPAGRTRAASGITYPAGDDVPE